MNIQCSFINNFSSTEANIFFFILFSNIMHEPFKNLNVNIMSMLIIFQMEDLNDQNFSHWKYVLY